MNLLQRYSKLKKYKQVPDLNGDRYLEHLDYIIKASTPTLSVTGTSSISGANTGDQTITLSGDVSGTGTGAITTTIGAGK